MIAPDANPSRVRIADPGDEEQLFAMARHIHAENSARDPLSTRIAFDEAKVRRTLHRALYPTRDNQGTYSGHEHPAWIGVVGPQGAIEGSVYLAIEKPIWYSAHLCLVQLWCFVLPEFRQSTNLKDMIAFSRAFSGSTNIRPLCATIDNTGSEVAKDRQFRKQMGEPIAALYLYEGDAA